MSKIGLVFYYINVGFTQFLQPLICNIISQGTKVYTSTRVTNNLAFAKKRKWERSGNGGLGKKQMHNSQIFFIYFNNTYDTLTVIYAI